MNYIYNNVKISFDFAYLAQAFDSLERKLFFYYIHRNSRNHPGLIEVIGNNRSLFSIYRAYFLSGATQVWLG